MSVIGTIAKDEWRYWLRTKLAFAVLCIGLLLVIGSAVLTAKSMAQKAHERQHLQQQAEETFFNQPARHPHRMVHYGHYAFRTPPPLSMIDPGVDAYTGTSIFLEGHRQNTAMFADRQAGGGLAVYGSLSPAFLLQILVPLLLILIGYNTITREREGGTLAQIVTQGVSPIKIILGKGLALSTVAALFIVPLLIAAVFAIAAGEAVSTALFFVLGYFIYLLIWCAAIILCSILMKTANSSLAALLAVWVVFILVIPRLSTTVAQTVIEAPGKIETDFAVIEALSKTGDGHNAADPAFEELKANILKQYNVDSIADLPVNFRGVVAEYSEAVQTDLLNKFAENRMKIELDQARIARIFGWFSPVLGMRDYSMKIAGVDLETYHRFLRETEKLRFDFVQSLNKIHAEKLNYADDMNRSTDKAAEQRTRVSAENWKVLQEFNFTPYAASTRIHFSLSALVKLLFWFVLLLSFCLLFRRRLG